MPTRTGCQVAIYWGDRAMAREGHELATLEALAREIAAVKGCPYVGHFDPVRQRGPIYLVPRDTLHGEDVRRLGISGPDDLFGGAVLHPHIATKVITHPLVHPRAPAPAGWSHGFPASVAEDVLYGYSAFSREDALAAAAKVLARGRARFKPAHGIGGRGQKVVASAAEAEAFLQDSDEAALRAHGMVIEQDLSDVATFSVGQVRLDDLCVTYFGSQHQTTDNRGETVYGGSDLCLVKGGFETLLDFAPDAATSNAVRQAMRYDAAAEREFERFLASRRNYDLVIGRDAQGTKRSGVLEQSWRAGGASPAELLAVKAFRADPRLRAVRAATVETYGETEVPSGATVIYRGVDPDIGPLTKYSLIRSHGILHCAA